MKMRELIYTTSKAKKIMFAETDLTQSDILFEETDQYAILNLNKSKIIKENTRIKIMLAASKK